MKKKLLVWTMCLAFALSGNVFTAMAAQADEAVAADDTEEALDEIENVITDEDAEAFEGNIGNAGEDVTMTGLTASNGRIIAATFPEDFLPVGFHKGTYNYEGQTIDVANMDNAQVMLVYLADADGSAGDFYLLDAASLQVSEFVQIYNGNDQYLVVLDPGDSIVAPSGFTKVSLKWYGKIVNAWSLPGVTADMLSGSIFDSFKTLDAYAAMAGEAAVVNGSGDEADMAGELSEGADSLAGESTDTQAAAAGGMGESTGSYSLEGANPADFLLLYAANEQGTTGFYLFDKENNTYQRYVEISGTDEKVIDQYKNSARLRLIIIAVLAVLLVISLFVIFNLIISHKEDDEEDDVDMLRKKVAAKNRQAEAEAYSREGADSRRQSGRRRPVADEFEEEEEAMPRRRPMAEGEMPVRRRPVAEGEAPVRRRPVAEGEAPVRRRPVTEDEMPVRRRPMTEDEMPVRRRPVAEGEAPVRRRPVAEGEMPVRRRPVAEGEMPVRRRPVAEGEAPVRRRPMAEGEMPVRRRPVAEGEPVRRPRRREE